MQMVTFEQLLRWGAGDFMLCKDISGSTNISQLERRDIFLNLCLFVCSLVFVLVSVFVFVFRTYKKYDYMIT